MYEKFKSNLQEDTDIEKFSKYFLDKYENREKEIAMCFRSGSKIRTNNHLESFHRDFKYNYLSGKVNKRLDHCLYKLLEYVKDKGCKRIIKLERGKMSSQKKSIELRHKKSLNLEASIIYKESENSFIVKGKFDYNVEILETKCPVNCHLKCNECSVCIHEIKCSCMDSVLNGLICKHAHLVCRTEKVKKQPTSIPDVSEEIANVRKTLCKPRSTETSITDTEKLLEEIKNQISNLDPDKYQLKILEVNRMLRNVCNFITLEDSETVLPSPKSGNNLKIVRQCAFFSTRKERKISHRLAKPLLEDRINIRKALIDDETLPESDHQAYCLKSENIEDEERTATPAKKRKIMKHKYFI
ncbi:uncharacterized protein NPIL_301081, partial [Nephila pilipes]